MLPNRNLGAGLVGVKIRPVSANLWVEPDAPWKIGLKFAYSSGDTKSGLRAAQRRRVRKGLIPAGLQLEREVNGRL
jgi:hypothetical protein